MDYIMRKSIIAFIVILVSGLSILNTYRAPFVKSILSVVISSLLMWCVGIDILIWGFSDETNLISLLEIITLSSYIYVISIPPVDIIATLLCAITYYEFYAVDNAKSHLAIRFKKWKKVVGIISWTNLLTHIVLYIYLYLNLHLTVDI